MSLLTNPTVIPAPLHPAVPLDDWLSTVSREDLVARIRELMALLYYALLRRSEAAALHMNNSHLDVKDGH